MPSKRFFSFLRNLILVLLILAVIVTGLLIAQEVWHPFDEAIVRFEQFVADANQLLQKELFTGISIGLLFLALAVAVVPLLMPKVNKAQYLTASRRGLVAAVVFWVSQLLYNWAESLSRFWLIISILGIIVVVFILVELLALLMRQDEEVAFRTDMLASFTSGLAAGIVLKLLEMLVG